MGGTCFSSIKLECLSKYINRSVGSKSQNKNIYNAHTDQRAKRFQKGILHPFKDTMCSRNMLKRGQTKAIPEITYT